MFSMSMNVARVDVQQVELARELDVGLHRATHEDDLAVLLERRRR